MECDLHQVYGVDIEDDALMTTRSWRWLRSRVIGLLQTDCRVARHFAPPPSRNNTPAGGGGAWH